MANWTWRWLCLGVCLWSGAAEAQGFLDSLIGKPGKNLRIQTPEKQFLAELKAERKRLRKRLRGQRKREKARLSALRKDGERFKALSRKHRLAAGQAAGKMRAFHEKIARYATQHLTMVHRLTSASSSFSENLRSKRDVIQQLLDFDQERSRRQIQQRYVVPAATGPLVRDVLALEARLARARLEKKEAAKSQQELTRLKEQNRLALTRARRAMVKLTPLQGVGSSQRVPMRVLQETLLRLQFQYYRKIARWLRWRTRDEKLLEQVAGYRIRLLGQYATLLEDARKGLASRMRQGRFYFQALSFDLELLTKATDHLGGLLKTGPSRVRKVLLERSRFYSDHSPSVQLLFALLLCLLLLASVWGGLTARVRLSRAIRHFSRRVEAGRITRRLWGLVRMGLRAARDLLPYLLGSLVVAFLLWFGGFPSFWWWAALKLGGLLLAFRAAWSLTDTLFAADPELRFIEQLDDPSAESFRHTIKGFALAALCYLPFLWGAHVFGFPKAFTRWMDVFFFAAVLIALMILLLNKDAILTLIPNTHVIGRALIIFIHRFYPVLFFVALTIFGIYAWGYVNFASYLATGISLTLVLLTSAYGLYRLSWVFGLWLFGFSKGEGGVLLVEKRWARNLLRLMRMLSGVLLAFLSIALFFQIWHVGGGFSAPIRFLEYPFVHVRNTQITLLSVLKLLCSIAAAFWLSNFLKHQSQEYVYPALRMSTANQHAANTVLGYIVIIVGALFGLQWMGVGIGVLAVFAGIVGIGVGFGIQNIMSNFISGLIITFGQPIKVGDVIELDGLMGEVKEITGRSTTIETFEMRIVLIPNSEILTKKVINWSLGRPCVFTPLELGVAYSSDVPRVMETLAQIAQEHPQVMEEPKPALRFGNFGASSLDFTLWVAVAEPMRRHAITSELRVAIHKRFAEMGIEISFPQRDIHLNPRLEEALIQKLAPTAPEAPPPAPPHLSSLPDRPTHR